MTAKEADALAPDTVIHKDQKAAGVPAWLKIKVGARFFTGYDGGDATTVTVCSTRAAYKEFSSGGSVSCTHHKPGIKVHVVAYSNDYSTDGTTNFPILDIAADDGSWSGYTASLLGVQPRIPPGTVLRTEANDNAKGKIWDNRSDSYFSGADLADHIAIEVLKQDPSDAANSTLYVKVLSGKHAGKRGWMLDSGLETPSGIPIMLSI